MSAAQEPGRPAGPGADLLAELALAAALGAALFLPFLGSRDLWAPNEPTHAEVAREMLVSGEWEVPRLLGEIYPGKPPLLHWSIASAYRALGIGEWAARLPSALAGIVVLVATVAIGRVLFPGTRAGLFGACALAVSLRFFWQARWAEPDMLLAACTAVGVLAWLRFRAGGMAAAWTLVFALALGGAVLTKGPVAFVPAVAAVAAAEVFLPAARSRAARGIGLCVIAAGALALVGVWVRAAIHSDYPMGAILREQVVERTESGLHHVRPWHYYLWNFPGDLFPWTFFLPAAVMARATDEPARRARRFLLAWVLSTVAVFSLSPEKRAVYLLPVVPGAVLLLGWAASRALDDPAKALAGVRVGAAATGWLLLLVGGTFVALAASASLPPAAIGSPGLAAAGLALLAAGAGGLLAPHRPAAGFAALAGGTAAAWLAFSALLPALDARHKSDRPVAEAAAARVGHDPIALVAGTGSQGAAFYLAPLLSERLTFLPPRWSGCFVSSTSIGYPAIAPGPESPVLVPFDEPRPDSDAVCVELLSLPANRSGEWVLSWPPSLCGTAPR